VQDKSRIVNKHNCVDKMRASQAEECDSSDDDAVAFAEAVSSGAATSSAPPAAVVQDQAVIEGNMYLADRLAKQKASFKTLNSKARLAKLISMMEADGIGGDFLSWAESQFPAEYQVALKRVIEQFGIPGLE
jgi:hypothetical protein